MKIKLTILLLLFFFHSCSDEKVTNPPQQNRGSAQFSIPKSTIPSNVFSIVVELSQNGFNSISETVIIDEDYEDVIFLNYIPVGLWNISIEAKSIQGVTLYSGESTVEILDNQTVLLTITLEPIEQGENTGSLLISVKWGTKGLPDNWEYFENNPIVEKHGTYYDDRGVSVPFILKEPDGFKMWYASFPQETGGKMYVFYAFSQDGLKWERYSDEPVLLPGQAGEWDDGHVGEPTVIKIENKYIMYYGGFSSESSNLWNIGRAESFDGIVWTKDELPILQSGNFWDGMISPQSVLEINGLYFLYYSGRNYNESNYSIGLAISQDGKSWEKYTNNPIITASQSWEGLGTYYPEVHVLENGLFEMYYMNAFTYLSSFGRAYSSNGIDWEKDPLNPYLTLESLLDVNLDKIAYPRFIQKENTDLLYFTEFDVNNNKTINLLFRNN